jgi:RND family efflux transporter MFP subunit
LDRTRTHVFKPDCLASYNLGVREPTRRRAPLAVALLVCTSACGGGAEDAAPDDSAAAVAVETQPARIETLRDRLIASGLVVPAAATDWTVVAPEMARIAELPVAEGDAVQPGDLLVRLELPNVAENITAAELEVAAAQARASAARDEVARLAPLHERGMISRVMFDAARQAQADAEALQAQAQGKLALAQSMIERGIIRARFPGVVLKRWRQEGEFVAGTATDGILRVIDPAQVQVAIDVPITQFSRIQPGHPATVQSPAGAPEPAIVAARTPPTDAATPTGSVRLGFTAPTTLTLDTVVQAELVLEERRDVLVVPSAAVQRDGEGPFVLVAGDDGLAHRRAVRTGLAVLTTIQIAGGLEAGERVIVSGFDRVGDGTPIIAR